MLLITLIYVETVGLFVTCPGLRWTHSAVNSFGLVEVRKRMVEPVGIEPTSYCGPLRVFRAIETKSAPCKKVIPYRT